MNNNGLNGIVAGDTKISNNDNNELFYYGYSINDLSQNCEFEEVAFLLQYGKLPDNEQLNEYKDKLIKYRELPKELMSILKLLPKDSNVMSILQSSISYLGILEPENKDFSNQNDRIIRIISVISSIIVYWYNYSKMDLEIDFKSSEETIVGYFLDKINLLNDDNKKALNCSLILYAEHDFNASTFTSRVCASTKSDIYSCVASAIGTLKGCLHGGANEAAMNLINEFNSINDVYDSIINKLNNKELIMGFGHRVYGESGDPRTPIIKNMAKEISKCNNKYLIAEEIEKVMKEKKPNLPPNLDFYSAVLYDYIGIEIQYFTPLFVMSRISGWTSHINEQRSNNKIIRPISHYIGVEKQLFKQLDNR